MCLIRSKTKRKLLFVNVGFYGVLNAVEYSVVLPTLWLYISSTYESESLYFGLCLSGFHMSSLVFAPIFGFANDWGIKTKSLVMFANVFQIFGSILYLIRSEWPVFTARFVAGIGSAVGSLLYADVNRITTIDNRTPILAVLMLCRQVGLFVGPAFNLFLAHFDFYIGSLHVDRFTAPGFLMTVLWIAFQLFMGFSYHNVDQLEVMAEEEAANDGPSVRDPLLPSSQAGSLENHQNYGSNGINNSGRPDLSSARTTPMPSSSAVAQSDEGRFRYFKEFTSESIVVLFAVFFVSYFAQMTLETMVTPVTQRLFDFGELENALVYAVAGGVIFVLCIAIMLLGKRFDDRAMTLVGMIFMLISVLWAGIVLPSDYFANDRKSLLCHFVGSTLFDLVGLTTVCVTAMSLYSKLIDQSMQGFGMGVRRATISLALIMGPLWAGSLVDHLYLMLFVLFGLLLMIVIMFTASYSKMRPLPPAVTSDRQEAV